DAAASRGRSSRIENGGKEFVIDQLRCFKVPPFSRNHEIGVGKKRWNDALLWTVGIDDESSGPKGIEDFGIALVSQAHSPLSKQRMERAREVDQEALGPQVSGKLLARNFSAPISMELFEIRCEKQGGLALKSAGMELGAQRSRIVCDPIVHKLARIAQVGRAFAPPQESSRLKIIQNPSDRS